MNKNKIILLKKEELELIAGCNCECLPENSTKDRNNTKKINTIIDCITMCCFTRKAKHFVFDTRTADEIAKETVLNKANGQHYYIIPSKSCEQKNYPDNFYIYVSDLFK